MFGMLIGVGVLSAVSQQWATKYAKTLEEQKIEAAKQNANEISLAMENTILLENSTTYSQDLTASGTVNTRVLQQASTEGKTQGDENYLVKEVDSSVDFGLQNQKIVIAATDDTYIRNDIENLVDVDEVIAYKPTKNQAVEVFDSSIVRKRQVNTSFKYLNQAADSIYNFYAGNLRFPTSAEYDAIFAVTGLKDVWGVPFVYERGDEYAIPDPLGDQVARISMETPWGYKRTIQLNMN